MISVSNQNKRLWVVKTHLCQHLECLSVGFFSGNNPRRKKGEIYMIDYRYHIDITCECLLCTQVNGVCVHDESILYNLKDATLHTCAPCAI